MVIYYSEDTKCKKNELFCYRGERCLDVFATKMDKILSNLANFPRQKLIVLTDDQKTEHKDERVCYLCGDKFDEDVRKLTKSKTIVTTVTAHSTWSLHCWEKNVISVLAHNASEYHNHSLIVKTAEIFKSVIFIALQKTLISIFFLPSIKSFKSKLQW